jgi:hypothetical protein
VDHDDDADARQGDNTCNILPFKPRKAAAVMPQGNAAKSTQAPFSVRKVLSAFPKGKSRSSGKAKRAFPKGEPVSLEKFARHKLRLPYGRWITDDGTKVLYNRKYQPLLVWRPGADKAERCDPHWVSGIMAEGWFYIDASVVNVRAGSLAVIGRSELYHALKILMDAWDRGDRAAADALEAWLLGKREQYLKLVEQRKAERVRRRAEYEWLVGTRFPAKT